MSKIRQNIEFYRLGTTIETEIGSDNVSDLYSNTYSTSGQLKDITVGTDTNDTTTLTQLSGSAGYNGFQRFPNGVMMQWGRTDVFQNTTDTPSGFLDSGIFFDLPTITFPEEFYTTCYNITLTITDASSDPSANDIVETTTAILSADNTQFLIRCARLHGSTDFLDMRVYWQAIGDWDITA